MSGIGITIPQARKLSSLFGGFQEQLPTNLRKATGQARKLLVDDLTDYPPEPPGSRYTRTYELRRGWQRASPIVGTRFELVNPVEHASFAQGDRQAWMHVDRWRPASEIAQEHEQEVVDLYDDAVKDTIQ